MTLFESEILDLVLIELRHSMKSKGSLTIIVDPYMATMATRGYRRCLNYQVDGDAARIAIIRGSKR